MNKEELREEAVEMLERIKDENILILLHSFIKAGHAEDKLNE